MSMVNYLISEVLFDPVYELHDMYKLSLEVRYMYGIKPGTTYRSELEAGAVDAAMTVWLDLWGIITQIERGGDDSEVCI